MCLFDFLILCAFNPLRVEHHYLPHEQHWCARFCCPRVFRSSKLTHPSGSDILAHPTASDNSGIVTPLARTEVLERVSEQFPPELLNRLDSMLVFNRLSHDSVLRVVDLRLGDVAARLAQRRIKLAVNDAARAWLAEKGFSDVYGARAIARVVRTEVLFPLARKMLVGTIR
jgi:ATP-dependent Clp protease ATP-binding subunit ClpB